MGLIGLSLIAFAWGSMTFMVVAVMGLAVAHWLLPAARTAIFRAPPTGPAWARRIWDNREQLYGLVLMVAAFAGLFAGLVAII